MENNATEPQIVVRKRKALPHITETISEEKRDEVTNDEFTRTVEKFKQAKEQRIQSQHRALLIRQICALVRARYNCLLLHDIEVPGVSFEDHRANLRYLIRVIEMLCGQQCLNSDLILWIMTKLFLCRLNPYIDSKMGNTLQDSMLQLFNFLSEKLQKDVFSHIIDKFTQISMNKEQRLSFNSKKAANPNYDISLHISVNTRQSALLYLIQFLKHSLNLFEELPSNLLLRFWICLHDSMVCNSNYMSDSLFLQNCVFLANTLIQKNLCPSPVFRLLFEAVLNILERVLNMESNDAQLQVVKQELFNCLRFVGESVFSQDTSIVDEFTVEEMMHWALRLAMLITKLIEATSFNQNELNVVITTLGALNLRFTEVESIACFDTEDTRTFLSLSKKIVIFLLKTCARFYSPNSTLHLIPFIGFLIFIDTIKNSSENRDFIIGTYTSLCKALHRENPENVIALTHSIAVSLDSKDPFSKELLVKFLPNRDQAEQWMQLAPKLRAHRGKALLTALFKYIAELSKDMDANEVDVDVFMALLSVPWLQVIDLTAEQRHRHKLPILKAMNDCANPCRGLISTEAMCCTLKALCNTKITGWSEWRRHTFAAAFSLGHNDLVQAALSSFPRLIATTEVSSHESLFCIVLDTIKYLPETEEDIENTRRVLLAIYRAICATKQACDTCEKARKNPIIEKSNISMQQKLADVLFKIFTDKRPNSSALNLDKLRIGASNILFACIAHGQNVKHELLKASFSLLSDSIDLAKEHYLTCFTVIVATLQSNKNDEELAVEICERLKIPRLSQAEAIKKSVAYAPFLQSAALNLRMPNYADKCFHRLFSKWLRYLEDSPESKIIEWHLTWTIRVYAKRNHITTKQFFLRKMRYFCREIAEQMHRFAFQTRARLQQKRNAHEALLDTETEVDQMLWCIAKIFQMSKEEFIENAGLQISSQLLILCDMAQYYRDDIFLCLDRLRFHMQKQATDVVLDALPSVVAEVCGRSVMSKTCFERLKKVYIAYGHVSLSDAWHRRRFVVIYALLCTLSLNAEQVLERLRRSLVNVDELPNDLPTALTFALKHNCEYLGFLLLLRKDLTDDHHYENRETLLSSLCMIINFIDRHFLDSIAAKILVLLRCITLTLGKMCTEVWTSFVKAISPRQLTVLMPQILIAIEPLCLEDNENSILEALFDHDFYGNVDSDEILRTARVLAWQKNSNFEASPLASYLRIRLHITDVDPNVIIEDAVRLLYAECDVVGRVVLQRLHANLDGFPLDDSVVGLLVRGLLYTIRNCGEPDVRELASRCLGRVGAVDPGCVGLSLAHRMAQRSHDAPNIFVNDEGDKFAIFLLERAWRCYVSIVKAENISVAEYSLQCILKTLTPKILEKVPNSQCRQDLEPLVLGSFLPQGHLPQSALKQPFIDNVSEYSEWLIQCFNLGVNEIRKDPLDSIFRDLRFMACTRDTTFIRDVLPHVILELIIEKNDFVLDKFVLEMESTLKAAVKCSGWQRTAANATFFVLDMIEAYVLKMVTQHPQSNILKFAQNIINRMISMRTEDGEMLLVVAAEKCCCLLRALRWCEQYAISDGNAKTKRREFYMLERIYAALQDVDGVQGAFESIRKCACPAAEEAILASEAVGDFNEAMPLYDQCSENKEIRLLKALLRQNQPALALTSAEKLYALYNERNQDPAYTVLEDIQIEAAWNLRQWKKLDTFVNQFDLSSATRDTSWGASCAAVFHAVRTNDAPQIALRINAARTRITNNLVAMTMEDADAYAQSYLEITRLHVLDEVEEFYSHQENSLTLEAILSKWKQRSRKVVQDAAVLEPMLRVRRELLAERESPSQICHFLLQSCRLARQSGHLQIAWTYLVEAKGLQVSDIEVGIEEARFLFQKNNAPASIKVLNKLIESSVFSNLCELFNLLKKKSNDKELRAISASLKTKFPQKLRAQFAELQLLAAEYSQKSGTRNHTDLYPIYDRLRYLGVPSEDLLYRVGVFYDALLEKGMEANTDRVGQIIGNVIQIYVEVLRYGRSHALHVMPRMLSIWLDYTENRHRKFELETTEVAKRNAEEAIIEICSVVSHSLNAKAGCNALDSQLFIDAFPQLISRVGHPSEHVFAVLKDILVQLICKFPHQCLWQSIAVYRPDKDLDKVYGGQSLPESIRQQKITFMKMRLGRIHRVFDAAQLKQPRLTDLIDQYDYAALLLLDFASRECENGHHHNLNSQFKSLFNFFADGQLEVKQLARCYVREKLGYKSTVPYDYHQKFRTVKVQIMVPYTELMMHAIKHSDVKVLSLSQIAFDMQSQESSCTESAASPEEVFVRGPLEDFYVFNSLARPKKFSFRGYNGKEYPMLAKSGDELRKDARFNDVNRMMNSLMRSNQEARRRQLLVKTYTVVPLASLGGIMEWLPNLETYRSIVVSMCTKKTGVEYKIKHPFEGFARKTDEERMRIMREEFYPAYPLVLAEWFRRRFSDPCSWQAARLAYSRSLAVMSMIGFVMGLGDRHAENILIDTVDGMVAHVDCNLIFNRGEQLPVPEIVPFRLTRNMVDGLGPTGVEGAFRKACEVTMSVMRENKDTLLTVIATFVHDPLVEFFKAAERAVGNRQTLRQVMPHADPKKLTSAAKEQFAKECVSLITQRLEGHIVSTKASLSIANSSPMIVEGQVDRLIELATDELLLSKMYLGWSPYL